MSEVYRPGTIDPLAEFLAVIAAQLADGARPTQVRSPRGMVTLDYRVDEEGQEYVFVPYRHHSGAWWAEIDGETYGQIQGFRYYPD